MYASQCLRQQKNILRVLPFTVSKAPAQRSSFQCLYQQPNRNFSVIALRRPILPPKSPCSPLQTSQGSVQVGGETLDLLPKISTHPALHGTQIRNGPRATYNPSHLVRKRRHGFLARLKSRTGRNILKRRRTKRRTTLSH